MGSKFGEMVREMRHQHHMTLEELAGRIGTNKSYISGFESGKVRPPRPDFVEKICSVFNLNFPRMLAIAHAEKAPKLIRDRCVEVTLEAEWE